jgi:hypothetical protein
MSIAQMRAPEPVAPVARRAAVACAAPAPTAALQRSCAGECTCGGTCGGRDVDEHDELNRTLGAAVAARAPAGLLQRLKYPGQTCPDETLDNLHTAMKAVCNKPYSCTKGRLSCDDLKERHATARSCHTARKAIETDCFGGNSDSGHKSMIQAVESSEKTCANMIASNNC